MSVLVVGSVALDSVETPFGKVDDALGGSATYFGVAASYFCPVRMVAVVGTDFPEEHVQLLLDKNLDLDGLERQEGKTFRWGGVYKPDLNDRDTLFTHLNVFETFQPTLPDSYRTTPYVFLANIHPDLQREVLSQMEQPELVVMDTMNLWIETTLESLKQTLQKVDILIINDSEAKQLAGEHNLVKAAAAVRAMGPNTLIIKKGEHGAIMFSEGQHFIAPAYPLEHLFDPTGAGDTFAGGFVGYLAKTGDTSDAGLRRAVIYGSTLASYCVERFGVERLKELTEADIDDRFQGFRRMTWFE